MAATIVQLKFCPFVMFVFTLKRNRASTDPFDNFFYHILQTPYHHLNLWLRDLSKKQYLNIISYEFGCRNVLPGKKICSGRLTFLSEMCLIIFYHSQFLKFKYDYSSGLFFEKQGLHTWLQLTSLGNIRKEGTIFKDLITIIRIPGFEKLK